MYFCYLRDSGVYVHESCSPGNQRHPLTYVGRRRLWYGPLTKYRILISLTGLFFEDGCRQRRQGAVQRHFA